MDRRDRRRLVWLSLGLVAATFVAYAQVAGHDFIGWDDDAYLSKNPQVYRGLSTAGVGWAFTTFEMGNWHPLTWLSHQLDCELFGLEAGGHHLVSVGLHAVAALLLGLALFRMTGALWPAFWVAALFALHPLRVESVAWASERKDVLAALFWMLVLLAWAGYVRHGGRARYLGALAALALGLMSKAMLVTLPFVLLLLDVWPLRRWRGKESGRRLIVEKLPLIGLAVVATVVGVIAQRSAAAVASTSGLGIAARLQNAAVSYLEYLLQTVWPAGLAYYYPHPALIGDGGLSPVRVAVALLLLLAVSWAALRFRRSRPWLIVGWLWFLGTLVPVIGLLQLGMQARADRYTYLPSVGLYLMVAWTVAAIVDKAPRRRSAVAAAAAASVVACSVVTVLQLRHWEDSRAVAERALAVTRDNFRAHDLLGIAFEREGRLREAAEQFNKALEIHPACSGCRLNLAMVLGNLGDLEQGRALFEESLRVAPGKGELAIRSGLGGILQRQGDLDGAREQLERALAIEPEFAEARNNLGTVYEAQGRSAEARAEYERAIRAAPAYALAHQNLGSLLLALGDLGGAARALERAVELKPSVADAHFKLAVVRVNRNELGPAVAGFERVLELEPQNVDALYNLGVLLAAQGRAAQARGYLSRLLQIDPQHAQTHALLQRLAAAQ